MSWNPAVFLTSEPRRVTLVKGEWVDAARRGRVVPYKIYQPEVENNEKLPVIVWSHGLGGSRDGAGFISRFVASHSYIIVHLQHGGTDSSLWEGKPGHPWDVIRATKIPRRDVLNRYRDVPFALKQMQTEPFLAAHGDFTRMGMSGHSFGALTTQIMAGQNVVRGTHCWSLYNPAFRAGILYSPVPGRKDPPDMNKVYGGIRMPLLHMTGTDDLSPIEGFGHERRLNVYNYAGNPDQHLVILKGGDHMVFNGSRGKLGANPARDRHEEIIKILSLAWWDWRLKDNADAQDWFAGGGARSFAGDDASMAKKS